MKRILPILLAIMLFPTTPVFAAEKVQKTNSPEDLIPAADTEAFFDLETVENEPNLATDELNEAVSDIISNNGEKTAEKKITNVLEDSGYYEVSDDKEVTALFANQRIRLDIKYTSNLDTHNAAEAIYYKNHYLLSYNSEEETKVAYDLFIDEYGKNAVLLDIPLKFNAQGWGTAYMGMDKEQNVAASGADVTVAVLDSGINRNHEIFNGKTVLQGIDIVNEDDDPADDNFHGTAVAGVIAESTPSNVKILPIKVTDVKGEGGALDIIYGLDYAVENGADIINISLGAFVKDTTTFNRINKLFNSTLKDSDAVLVVAAGNETTDLDGEGVNEFPGELDRAVCVSAIRSVGTLCSFSNYGSAVDFAAPGQSIKLAHSNGGYTTANGTSFSSPYVAAAAALVKAENPTYTASQVENALINTSKDLGNTGKDVQYGNGCPIFKAEEPSQTGTNINTATISGISDKTFTGSEITQPLSVSVGDKQLVENTDYTVQYTNNLHAGQATVTVNGINDYFGSTSRHFTINRKEVTPTVSLSKYSYVYDGTVKTPTVTAYYGSTVLSDYTVSYASGRTNVGTYKVSIVLQGDYSGTGSAEFTITPGNKEITTELSQETYEYNGTERKPLVTVKFGGTKLTQGPDYTVSYANGRVNVGNYAVIITMKGNYEGTITRFFTITPKKVTPNVTLLPNAYTYNGQTVTPRVTVQDGNRTLSSSEYTVSYPQNAVNAGSYAVNVDLKGNYTGSGRAVFAIYKTNNTISVYGRTLKIKYKKVKKKNQYIAPAAVMSVWGNQGGLSYYKISGNKKITVSPDGTIKVKKKTKKGTYKLMVNVVAAGDANHLPDMRTVTFKIKIK